MKCNLFVIMCFLFTMSQASGQRDFKMSIYIDEVIDGGELDLFQGIVDKNKYWYVPKNPTVAKNKDGTPKFSFIKWVDNENDGADEGVGGGVLHCVFGFKATREQIRSAQNRLRRINPQGQIVGPVIFKEGTATLTVPNIDDPSKNEVLAMGPAPVAGGSNVATNLIIPKRSTSLLWDSFNTPNPLVVIRFDMTLAGYLHPMEAKITIDREQISKSRKMQLGVATPWLGAEVEDFLREMHDNGNIKVEKLGANFDLQKVIDETIKLAQTEFFSPMGSLQGEGLRNLTGVNGQSKSFIDKATKLLNSSRAEAKRDNSGIRRRNQEAETEANRKNRESRNTNEAERKRVEAENDRRRKEAKERVASKGGEFEPSDGGLRPDDKPYEEIELVNPNYIEEVSAEKESLTYVPQIAVTASFVRRKIIMKGKKVISFKETHPSSVPWQMQNGIGISFRDCRSCFRETVLEDLLFKQRNIVPVLDGLNETDFKDYLNSAVIQIRKIHEDGTSESNTEVTIHRNNLTDGKIKRLMYGGKPGDKSISKWKEYQYRVVWNFVGGIDYQTDWINANTDVINVAAPIQKERIEVSGEKAVMNRKEIRSATVTIYSDMGIGQEKPMPSIKINPNDDLVKKEIDILIPIGSNLKYEYEIIWQLYGGGTKRSGRKSGDTKEIFVDQF